MHNEGTKGSGFAFFQHTLHRTAFHSLRPVCAPEKDIPAFAHVIRAFREMITNENVFYAHHSTVVFVRL